jgi:hypothetical protein
VAVRGKGFSLLHSVWGPPILLSSGYRGNHGLEDDYSPPSSAEVKNAWSCTSTHNSLYRNDMIITGITLLLFFTLKREALQAEGDVEGVDSRDIFPRLRCI